MVPEAPYVHHIDVKGNRHACLWLFVLQMQTNYINVVGLQLAQNHSIEL